MAVLHDTTNGVTNGSRAENAEVAEKTISLYCPFHKI